MNICLNENLKRLRKSKGITQEELASYLGVSFQAISKWERNENYPDISMLPELARFFGVSVDALLGVNSAENEKKINEYLTLYDTMHFKKTSQLFEIYKNAVNEFPDDFRILVRYMELLMTEKDKPFIKAANQISSSQVSSSNSPYDNGFVRNPEYEKISQEISNLYERIQNCCTQDDIRIWSKHIMIKHLVIKHDLSYDDESGKWKSDKEALEKSRMIQETMPSLRDAKESLSLIGCQDASEFMQICKNNIEELSFLLQESLISYCYYPYDNDFSPEFKIDVIKHINGIIQIIDNDEYVSKNRINLIYNYGHLGHLYAQIGDEKQGLECLKISAQYARAFDANPDEAERISRFYENSVTLREMNMCERMKLLMTEHYPLSDAFKSKAEFAQITDMLTE